jgi:hypothetical protein
MASPKANSDEFDDTQTLYVPHLEHKTQAQAGMSALHLINRILILSPGETDGGSSSEPSDIEKVDKEMFERWKDEADSALVFVCTGSTTLCIITL